MKREFSNILGVNIDRLNTKQVIEKLEQFIHSGKSRQIVYINVDGINKCYFDQRYRKIVEEADLVYPDGMGVVWASRLTPHPLPERVNAGDFLPQFCRICKDQGYKLYLLGGQRGIARQAAHNLRREFPGLQIAGIQHGFFHEQKEEEIIEQINRSGAEILLVGLGVPRQEKWISRNLSKLNTPVCWGVGGLFDYYSLRIRRAPLLLRRMGLEWVFRLVLEPKRLWRRYVAGNFIFFLRLFAALILDSLFISAGWIAAYWIRYGLNDIIPQPINSFRPYVYGLPGIIILWLLSCTYFGLYKHKEVKSKVEEFSTIIKTVLLGILIAMAFSFLFKEFQFGRTVVFLSGFLNLFLLGSSHWIIGKIDQRIAQKHKLKKILIIGAGKLARRVKRELEDSPRGYQVIGLVSKDKIPGHSQNQEEIMGNISQLEHLLKTRPIDEVWVATEEMGLGEKMNLVTRWKEMDCEFKIVSDAFRPFAARVEIDKVGGFPLFDLSRSKVGPGYEYAKNILDFLVSLGIILFTFPLLFLLALTLKLGSPGPVFFAQQRMGKNGKIFPMYKFRTMHNSVKKYELAPQKRNDSRITKIGRILRLWSLDELPQLLNVLKGEMSIVGPRPEMVFLAQNYQPWERERLSVKPGITGLWQVAGRKDLPLHKHIEYDFYYIKHRSTFLDLAIICKTIPAVFKRRGAY